MSKSKELHEMRNLEEIVNELRKDMDKRMEELKVQMETVQKKAAKTVTERPLLALGVAFVVGMALGVALSKAGE